MRPILQSLALTLLFVTAAAGAQTRFSSLEERMSQAEFHAAGLDKLSPEELKYLDAWLSGHGAINPSGKTPNFYPEESGRQAVDGHLVGTFTGWRGRTEFTLDNGQVWQQVESGELGGFALKQPAVKIKPMMLGSWLMYVEGCGCSIRVERVK